MLASSECALRYRKSQRLLGKQDFDQVFAHARAYKNRCFTVLVRTDKRPTDLAPPQTARLGLVVAKRKVRLAVSRNRVKRLTRERFRYHARRLPAADVIVMANSACTHTSNKEIIIALDELFTRMIARHR